MICFTLGLVLILFYFSRALNFYSHVFFSVHMFQMSLLFFFIPVLILSGLPAFNAPPRLLRLKFAARLRTSPIFHNAILGFFAVVFSVYHLPVVFDTVMRQPLLHDFVHVILMVLSFLVWWPVATSSNEEQSNDLKRNYIFKMLILLMPACLFLVVTNTSLYKVYSDPTFLNETLRVCFPATSDVKQYVIKFNFLSAIGDQRLGGLMMIVAHKLVSYWLLKAP